MEITLEGEIHLDHKKSCDQVRLWLNKRNIYVKAYIGYPDGPSFKFFLTEQQVLELAASKGDIEINLSKDEAEIGIISTCIGYSAADLGPGNRNILDCHIKLHDRGNDLEFKLFGKASQILINTIAAYCRPKMIEERNVEYYVQFFISKDCLASNFEGDLVKALLSFSNA